MRFEGQFRSVRAFSLIEGMVMVAILSIAGFALMKSNSTAMKALKSSDIRAELLDIKRTISGRISCPNTLGAIIPTNCSGPVALRDKDNSNLIPSSGKLGRWTITSRCEFLSGRNGLSIYATMQNANGGFSKDPLVSGTTLDENSPISLLFKAELRLCAGHFDPSPAISCPAGQAVSGFYPGGQPICVATTPAVSCPTGQSLSGFNPDGTPICFIPTPAISCPAGQALSGISSQGMPICSKISNGFQVPEATINAVLTATSGAVNLCNTTAANITYLYCTSGCTRWCQGALGSGHSYTAGTADEIDGLNRIVKCICY